MPLPHTGELILIIVVALIIFGLGRLPHMAERIAKATVKGDPPGGDDA